MSEDLDEAARRVGDGYRQALLRTGFYTSRAHSLLREDCVLHMYEIMDAARRIFVRLGWDAARIERASVLEVGCAWGLRLNQMPGFGLRPENMHGIDLLEEYIAEARKSNPGISYEVMSGTDLKFGDGAFDFSMAVMSLSAMIDGRLIDQVLAEMCRVSREFVLVCDNFDPNYRNLRNGKTVLKGVSTRHVEKLRSRDDVESLSEVSSFWSDRRWAWAVYKALNGIGLKSIAYALAIRTLSPHSHRVFLVRLKRGNGGASR